jgi:hypothetical protein
MAAWFGGRVFCCFAGIESATVWFAADAARMAHLPNTAIYFWSIPVRVLIYTVVAVPDMGTFFSRQVSPSSGRCNDKLSNSYAVRPPGI